MCHSSARWAMVSLLLLLMLVLRCDAKNACGGDRALQSSPGVSCNPGPHATCEIGTMLCAGQNSLYCACVNDISTRYQSSISHERGWNLDNDFCEKWKCGEHGVCLTEKQACHCYPGYSGNHCEIHNDPCAHQTCGAHGTCINGAAEGEWRCHCLEGYTGPNCETQTKCQPNGVWKNGVCKCKEGYTGKRCTSCDRDGICLPTTDNEQPFALTFASELVRQELLESPLPPKIARRYAADHPILPNTEYEGVLYDCDCRAVQHETGETSLLSENFLYIDDDYWSPYDFGRPSPHHYREDFDEYYHYNYYDVRYQNAVAVIFTLIFLGLVAWFILFPTRTPPEKTGLPERRHYHQQSQPFVPHTGAPVSSHQQQTTDMFTEFTSQ